MDLQTFDDPLKLLTLVLAHMREGVALHEMIYDEQSNPIDYRVLYVNEAFEELTTLSKDAVIGKLASEAYQLTDAPYLREYARVVEEGKMTTFEASVKSMHSDFSVVVVPVQNRFFVTIFSNITTFKKQQSQLANFKYGLEKLNDIVFMTDKDGVFNYVNKSFTDAYGYTLAELLGKTPRVLKSGKQTNDFYDHFWKTLTSKDSISTDLINVTKSGAEIVVSASASPILDENQEIVGFLAVQRNVTEERQAKEQLEQKIIETDTINRLMVSRELKMIELKEKIAQLKNTIELRTGKK
jgi:PAS domain S-box-containing protein